MRPRAALSAHMVSGLPGWLSFQRAGEALFWNQSGHLENAAPNQPRIAHDPVSLEPQGLLIEPAATNLLTHSNASLGGGWSEGATQSTNLSLNALGLFAGVSVASTGAGWGRLLHDDLPEVTAGRAYHFTLYYRAGTSGRLRVIFRTSSGQESRFAGPIGGTFGVSSTNAGAVIIRSDRLLADGQTRVLSVALTAAVSGGLSVGIGPDSTTAGHTIILLAAQLEQGGGTSFIATNGAAGTRSADLVSMTGLSGVYDVTATYGDGSVDRFPAQSIVSGYWPALTKPVLQSLKLRRVTR